MIATEPIAPDTQLARVIRENQLSEQAGEHLMAAYQPYFREAQPLIEEAKSIKVEDATCVTEMKRARAVRLKLKDVRVSAEKTRKALKEDSLRAGRAIDGINSVLLLAIEPVERVLEEQEKFAERAEAARKAKLGEERARQLAAIGADLREFIGLAEMGEEQWRACLHGAKTAKEEREKAEATAAAERKAREEEAARLREENERLQREARARDQAAAKEREAIEARANAEREKLAYEAKIEREARQKAEREVIEAKRELDRQAAEEAMAQEQARAREAAARLRAEHAPDADKLRALARTVRSLELPEPGSAAAKKAIGRFVAAMIAAVKELERDAAALK